MRKWVWPLAALALVLAGGCSSSGGGFSERKSDQAANVLRYPIPNNPTTMDPAMVQDGDTIDLLHQVYEGLVGWGTNNEPVPLVAEKWEVSPDGLTYTFTIRGNITFHNGKPVTADDVIFSLERATNPKLASPVATAYLDDIQGVMEKFEGKAPTVSGLKKVDDKTVSITLKRPTPYFLGKFTYLGNAIVPKDGTPADTTITETAQMIGTGPFKVTEVLPEQKVSLAANETYWGGKPALDGIERLVIGDALTRLSKFKNGEVDMVQLERQDVEGLKNSEFKDQLVYLDRPAIWYVAMNQLQYEPFKKKEVRQAFAMSINRERIVNEILGGINQVANGIVPPGVPGHRENAKVLPFDPAKAKEMLAAAGYPDPSKMPALTLTFRDERPDIRRAAEAVATDIKTNLGVDVKLQAMEWGAYLDKLNKKEQVFFHMRWAADYLDPQNFLSHMLATNAPENKLGYSNPEFDRLTGLADREMDSAKRLPIYAQAEDIILDDAVWVPIYFQRDVELQSPRLSGLRESLFGHLPHTTTQLK